MNCWRAGVARLGILALLWSSSKADINVMHNLDDFEALAETSNGFPSQRFRSSPIISPVLQVNSFDAAGIDQAGYLFLGTVYGDMKAGPMILDAGDLSLIYADQRYENTYASSVQEINGTRYLAFWYGGHTRGHANGFCLVFDEAYNLIYNVTAKGSYNMLADMHELKLTNEGTAIFSAYWNIPFNCSPVNGPADAILMDSGFQEVDLATNRVLFSWAASDHFDIADSFAQYSSRYGVTRDSGFDFFHINAVEKTPAGDYLISSRHMSLLALISGRDGHPLWVLGGKQNQFTDLSSGKATNFSWQHDARFWRGNLSHITMFDNHGERTGICEGAGCKTRGLHLEIDEHAMTARIVHEYYHPDGIDSGAMGSMQTLDNGNMLLGWGYNPSIIEYNPDGTPVMDIQRGRIGTGFLADMFAYRVSKHDWVGRPPWGPSVAVTAPYSTTQNATVYVSWNGATEVATWAVFASPNSTDLNSYDNLIATHRRTGFETGIFLDNHYKPNAATQRYITAAALAQDGTVLGSTAVLDLATGEPVVLQGGITSVGITPLPPPTPGPVSYTVHFEDTNVLFGMILVTVVVVLAFLATCWCCEGFTQRGYKKWRYRRVCVEEN